MGGSELPVGAGQVRELTSWSMHSEATRGRNSI